MDCGSGQHRKGLLLNRIGLSNTDKDAVIEFHAFTGNDYVSAFFRKGKTTYWKTMKLKSQFLEAFKSLGLRWHLTETTFNVLEEYVCMLYRQNTKDVNAARSKMFLKKYSSTSKIINLVLLPPCRSVLYLHAQRENYVAKIWKSSTVAWQDIPNITDHGWFDNGEID